MRELEAAGLPNEKIFNLVSLSDSDGVHFASASSIPSILSHHNNAGVCTVCVGVSHLETSQNNISHTLAHLTSQRVTAITAAAGRDVTNWEEWGNQSFLQLISILTVYVSFYCGSQ